jgi:hypothetical protein
MAVTVVACHLLSTIYTEPPNSSGRDVMHPGHKLA